jgi:hypothetical protein
MPVTPPRTAPVPTGTCPSWTTWPEGSYVELDNESDFYFPGDVCYESMDVAGPDDICHIPEDCGDDF